MPLLIVLAHAVWAALLLVVLSARSTLGARTLLTYGLLGVLLATILLPLVPRLLTPYGEQRAFLLVLVSLTSLFIIVAPVVGPLFKGRGYPSLSVADMCSLGFFVGFGADAAGLLLAAGAAADRIQPLQLWPPWTIETDTYLAVGFAYRAALVALVSATSLRMTRRMRPAIAAGSVAFLILGLERAAALMVFGGQTTILSGAMVRVFAHGLLLPWITLGGLVAASVWEGQRVDSDTARAERPFQSLEQLFALARLVISRRWQDHHQRRAAFAVERQLAIVSGDLIANPHDPTLLVLKGSLERRGRESRNTAIDTPTSIEATRHLPRWLVAARAVVGVLLVTRLRAHDSGQGRGARAGWHRASRSLHARSPRQVSSSHAAERCRRALRVLEL